NLGGDLSIDLFASGVPVESFTLPNRGATPELASNYLVYGFESSAPFNQVALRAPGDGRFDLDNLRFENAAVAAIPEPGTLTLLGLGAFGVLGYHWRQRRREADDQARFGGAPQRS